MADDPPLTPLPAEAPWLLRWLTQNWDALWHRMRAYIAVGVLTVQTVYQLSPDFRSAVTPSVLHWWSIGLLVFSVLTSLKRKESP